MNVSYIGLRQKSAFIMTFTKQNKKPEAMMNVSFRFKTKICFYGLISLLLFTHMSKNLSFQPDSKSNWKHGDSESLMSLKTIKKTLQAKQQLAIYNSTCFYWALKVQDPDITQAVAQTFHQKKSQLFGFIFGAF